MKKAYITLLVIVLGIAALGINFSFLYRAQNLRLLRELADAKTEKAVAMAQAQRLIGAFGVRRDAHETVVTYSEYDGDPVQLVVDKETGRTRIQIDASMDKIGMQTDAKVLNFLRGEVERLVSSPNTPIHLGRTSITFKFTGGLPRWAPYHTLGAGRQSSCLYFAETGTENEDCIEATGLKEIVGYWPYQVRAN